MPGCLISIIIPAYNASEFISETLDSIIAQEYQSIEIILIDDGSTDNTKEIVSKFTDPRIRYYYQVNAGVSAARNNGIERSKGDVISFFDADDKMTLGFLNSRLNYLLENHFDFASGPVAKFTEKGILNGTYYGTSNAGIEEILLYNHNIITCPSNYLFNRAFLIDNSLKFNENLTSTADRLFLIKAHMKGKGDSLHAASNLLYRVNPDSMSNNFSIKLVTDNEKFYRILLDQNLIPRSIRTKSLFLGYYILSASFWKLKGYLKAMKYALKLMAISPGYLLKKRVKEQA